MPFSCTMLPTPSVGTLCVKPSISSYLSEKFNTWAWDMMVDSSRDKLLGIGDMTMLENLKTNQLPALLLLSKTNGMIHFARMIDNKSCFNEVFDALVSTWEDFSSQNPIEAEEEESEASAAPSEASSAAADEIGFLDTWDDAATYEDLERRERERPESELLICQQIEEYEASLAADRAKKEKRLKEEAQKRDEEAKRQEEARLQEELEENKQQKKGHIGRVSLAASLKNQQRRARKTSLCSKSAVVIC